MRSHNDGFWPGVFLGFVIAVFAWFVLSIVMPVAYDAFLDDLARRVKPAVDMQQFIPPVAPAPGTADVCRDMPCQAELKV